MLLEMLTLSRPFAPASSGSLLVSTRAASSHVFVSSDYGVSPSWTRKSIRTRKPLTSRKKVEVQGMNGSWISRKYACSLSPATRAKRSTHAHYNKALIGVGSNMGDRFQNICDGMKELTSSESSEGNQRSNIILKDTSFLHETAPMYVTDQPSFINGVFEVETTLEPEALLKRLKTVEQRAGRHTSADGTKSIRYGPRPLDLDILLYQRFMSENSNTGDSHQEGSGKITFESTILDSEAEKLPLTIPHPRMHEREFVLSPICEIDPHVTHPILKKTMKELRHELQKQVPFEAYRVIPLPRQRFLQLNHTIVMGILNVTPDSFSDGGKVRTAVLYYCFVAKLILVTGILNVLIQTHSACYMM
jgi:2-amino-4-hydroxy-6-hydroxymethyldihydropteridine diphosphokinase